MMDHNLSELILAAFRRHVIAQPDNTVVKFIGGNDRPAAWTFRQLSDRVGRIAAAVNSVSGAGERALLLYPQGLEFIAAFMGCLAAGVIAVPAYPPRKNRNQERLDAIARDCQPSLIFTSREIAETLSQELIRGAHVFVTDELPDTGELLTDRVIRPEDIAYLQYTSGSTSLPKGAAISHGAIVANVTAIAKAYNCGATYRGVYWLPMYHDMGLVGTVLMPLYFGGQSTILSPTAFLQRPFTWLKALSDEQATVSACPNFGFDLCVNRITDDECEDLDLTSVQVMINAAEPVKAETIDRFVAKFSRCGFRSEAMLPSFGLAESTLFVTGGPSGTPVRRVRLDPVSTEPTERADLRPERWGVSCGRAAADSRVVVVDIEAREPNQDGKIGEIWVQSPSNASYYWNNRELTRTTFENRLSDGSGPFLNTGDLGFLLNGELVVTGRSKDLIIIRGRNLYPQDIENVVERSLPFATANTCAAVSLSGDGTERLGVVIEATREHVRTAKQIDVDPSAAKAFVEHIARLRQEVGSECEVSLDAVAFVRPGAFPRTTSGKVQRHKCREVIESDRDEVVYRWRASSPTAPVESALQSRNTQFEMVVEKRSLTASIGNRSPLADVIQGCLLKWLRSEVDPAASAVDEHAPFTSLGMDSVAAASIVLDVEAATGVRLTPDVLYVHQTIHDLASYVSTVSSTNPKTAVYSDPGAESLASLMIPAVPASENGTSQPTDQGTLGRRESVYRDFAERNRVAQRLRDAGRYFYGTELSRVDGPYAIHEGQRRLMLASFAYLGLVGHPEIHKAVNDALTQFGAGSHGAYLITGITTTQRTLQQRLAAFLEAEDALVFSSGYATNVATIAALVGPGDTIFADEYIHASLVDGCKLSGAAFQFFPHNNSIHLEILLHKAPSGKRLVIVDGVYSMEGDVAPMPEIVTLCQKYGALLMVDEAHSLGVIGKTGRGVQEHFNLPPDAIDIKMGTISKALASQGGFIAGKHVLIDYLRHHARGHVFSTSLGPPQVAAALKALEILQREPERVIQLQRNAARLTNGLRAKGFRLTQTQSAIVPLLCQTEEQALEMTAHCRANGLYVTPIVYPAVPMNAPRLRLNVMATHTDEQVDLALSVLEMAGRAVGLCRTVDQ